MNPDPSPILIPLRDFALPVPRTGSIEPVSGHGRAAAEGQAIHRRVQKRRAAADPRYRAEVPIGALFEREGFTFRVEGRIDGLFEHPAPRIEEIKTGLNALELGRRLTEEPLTHPYALQLLTYGYLYRMEHGVLPQLSFHLVSTRTRKSCDLSLSLELVSYEAWLEARLEELVGEAQRARKRAARRRRAVKRLAFPFPAPRPGQPELMAQVEQAMAERRPLLLQAPTGLGKTVGVLYPVLKEALARGQRTVYVTPKNSQHAVAEEAVERLRAGGARIRALSLTAKARLCFRGEPLCGPDTCPHARDHYAKVHRHELPALLERKRVLRAATFRALGQKYQVCPFELQLEALPQADLVICDYNYVFAPRSALKRVSELEVDRQGRPNLVVDEAHNLPARAMDHYSPALSGLFLQRLGEALGELPVPWRKEALERLEGCLATLEACGEGAQGGARRIELDAAPFSEQEGRLRVFLSRYLEGGAEIGRHDPVLSLCSYWSEFTAALELAGDPEREEFFTTYHPHPGGGTLRIVCCDASAMIEEGYAAFDQAILFSATLKPFEYYLRLGGLAGSEARTTELPTPFPPERRKLLIIPQISTRYSRREGNYAKIAEAVARIAALRRGNYFVFLPSFDFLERVAERLRPPDGFALLRQERGMKRSEVEATIETLRQGERPHLMLAVQGGSFAEGIDYPGETAIGAFVVGPPLPPFDLEREQMKRYYQRRYGAGFDYAYAIPAMARAVQAAGRVIRSETDRGLIVLMDSRFVEPVYTRAMPADWFENDPTELVSGSILKEVEAFWEGEDGAE